MTPTAFDTENPSRLHCQGQGQHWPQVIEMLRSHAVVPLLRARGTTAFPHWARAAKFCHTPNSASTLAPTNRRRPTSVRASLKILEEITASSNEHQHKAIRNMKNQENMTPTSNIINSSNWPQRKGDVWTTWQRIQNNCFKAQQTIREHC